MVFSSGVFLYLFLPTVLVLYFLNRSIRWRNTILMIASVIFYAWGEPAFVFVMLASVFVNWILARLIDHNSGGGIKSRVLCGLAIGFDVLIFFVFKYLNFALQNIGLLFHREWATDIALPIGISFFTFQIMSYILDVYHKKAAAQRNPLDLLLYISMFPQLIAGPIVRYETIANELLTRRTTAEDTLVGVKRFVFGLAKKVLIANYVAMIADNIFASTDYELAASTAWLGAAAYAFQIYFDFSGYSDMAIGLGRIFGFHFDENFNYPYIADSVTDFWRRWHISLSTWFRDYVYIPLGGNRVSKPKWIRNLLVVWLLTGIWHGANWTFILWGLYYFLFLLLEKTIRFRFKKLRFIHHVYTLIVVLIGWVLFRSEDIVHAGRYIGAMFGGGYALTDHVFIYYLKGGAVVFLAALVFSLPVGQTLKRIVAKRQTDHSSKTVLILTDIAQAVFLLALFALSVVTVANATYNPFIYFNF